MAAKPSRLEMLVCRWGNSLAVRLPAGSAIAMGVAEGDKLIAEISADGRLILSPERKVAGRTATRSLRRFLAGQEDTAPVVERIRRSARY